jgi:tRNA-2-methylthio-N6-dimethylallyladenosine synthase
MEDNVSKSEKKRREKELMKILRKTALANNKKYIGKVVEVLIEGKNKKGEFFGKTRTSKNVKISKKTKKQKNKKTNLIGKFVRVKITEVEDFGLSGVLL